MQQPARLAASPYALALAAGSAAGAVGLVAERRQSAKLAKEQLEKEYLERSLQSSQGLVETLRNRIAQLETHRDTLASSASTSNENATKMNKLEEEIRALKEEKKGLEEGQKVLQQLKTEVESLTLQNESLKSRLADSEKQIKRDSQHNAKVFELGEILDKERVSIEQREEQLKANEKVLRELVMKIPRDGVRLKGKTLEFSFDELRKTYEQAVAKEIEDKTAKINLTLKDEIRNEKRKQANNMMKMMKRQNPAQVAEENEQYRSAYLKRVENLKQAGQSWSPRVHLAIDQVANKIYILCVTANRAVAGKMWYRGGPIDLCDTSGHVPEWLGKPAPFVLVSASTVAQWATNPVPEQTKFIGKGGELDRITAKVLLEWPHNAQPDLDQYFDLTVKGELGYGTEELEIDAMRKAIRAFESWYNGLSKEDAEKIYDWVQQPKASVSTSQ